MLMHELQYDKDAIPLEVHAEDDPNNESSSGRSFISEIAEEEASTSSDSTTSTTDVLTTATALAADHLLSLRRHNHHQEELLKDNYILQQSDIDQVCQQLKEIMGEFCGVSVANLKIAFDKNNEQQQGESSSKVTNKQNSKSPSKETTKERSSSLTNHMQQKFPTLSSDNKGSTKHHTTSGSKEPDTSSASVVVPKIFGGSHRAIASAPWRTATLNLPSKEHADLQAQKELIEDLERDRNGMKTKLLQADEALKEWEAKCEKKQERCQALECQTETLKDEVETLHQALSSLEDEKKMLLVKNQELETANGAFSAKLQVGNEQVRKLKSTLEEETCPVPNEGSASGETFFSCPKEEAPVISSEVPDQFNEPPTTSKEGSPDNQGEAPALLDKEMIVVEPLRSEQLVAESRQDLEILVKKLNMAKQETLQSQLKLVEQIKRANDYENRLEACREQVEDLRRDRSTLKRKLQDLSKRAGQVAELEESVTTQQLQIESLSMVNRELRQKVVEHGGSCDDQDAEEDAKPELDGMDYDTDDDDRDHCKPSNVSSQIESLEALWDQHNAQMAQIQQEQVELFHRLGKSNSDATVKIDSLCDSMGELSRSWDDDQDTTTDQDLIMLISTDSSDKLEVIHESGQDICSGEQQSVIERCELAWKEQASKIEAIQRDQDEVICRIRSSTADAESKLHSLSDSIEEEDTHIDHSKVVRKKQNEVLRALQGENKRLAKKLRDSEAKAATHIDKLQEMLEIQKAKKDELQGTCRIRELCMAELKEEKATLQHKSETVRDLLTETDKMCEKQKEALTELELDKQSREKDLEAQRSIVGKMEEITTQQRETIECLRSERHMMECVIDEKNFRIKELEAVIAFQKTAIIGLQREKSTLTKRLLDTEDDFRNHLTRNLTVQAQIETLRNDLTLAVKKGNTSDLHSAEDLQEKIAMGITHHTDSTAETTFFEDSSDDNQCLIATEEDARDNQLAGEDNVSAGGELRTNENPARDDNASGASEDWDEGPTDKLVAEDVLRLMSFADV